MMQNIIRGLIATFAGTILSCSDVTGTTTDQEKTALDYYKSGKSYESITLDMYDLDLSEYQYIISFLPDTIASLEALQTISEGK